MRNAITKEAMNHLICSKFEYYENNLPAELNAKIEALHKTVETIDIIIYHFITKFIVILIYLYALWQQHWALSLAVFVWLINFVFSIGAMGSPEIARLGAKWAEIRAQNSGRRVEILRNIFVIKTFSSPSREMNFVSQDTDAETKVKWQLEVRMFFIWSWIWCTYYLIQCGAIGLYWWHGLSMGDLVSAIISLQTLSFSLLFVTFGLTLFDSELDPKYQ